MKSSLSKYFSPKTYPFLIISASSKSGNDLKSSSSSFSLLPLLSRISSLSLDVPSRDLCLRTHISPSRINRAFLQTDPICARTWNFGNTSYLNSEKTFLNTLFGSFHFSSRNNLSLFKVLQRKRFSGSLLM